MGRIALARLRLRAGRSLATALAVLAAVASFVLLTSASRGSQLREAGTVNSDYRPVYDILVRPAGAADPGGGKLLAPASAAGTTGGITLAQWQRILGTPGVSVAAPVAVVGYVPEAGQMRVDVRGFLKPGVASQVLRIDPTWVTDDGTTRISTGPLYFYATDGKLEQIPPNAPSSMQGLGCQDVGTPDVPAPKTAAQYSYLWCWSSDPSSTYTNAFDASTDYPYLTLTFYFPMLLAAVDPDQEAKLDGLRSAVTSGGYLPESPKPAPYDFADPYGKLSLPRVPVLTASRPETAEQLSLQIERVPGSAAVTDVTDENKLDAINALDPLPGEPVGTVTIPNTAAYGQLLDQFESTANPETAALGQPTDPEAEDYYSLGPLAFTGTANGAGAGGAALTDNPASGLDGAWGRTAPGPFPMGNAIPPDAADLQFGNVVGYSAPGMDTLDPLPADEVYDIPAPVLQSVGRFDPGRIDLGAAADALTSDWMQTPDLTALDGRPLAPDDNPAGPVSQSPTLITALSELPALENQSFESSGPGGVDPAAPISDVRVRVAGSIGMDALSRQRVLAVADSIHRETGLQVDIVDGSSPTTVSVSVPAGDYGRPALKLAEPWVEKGVATAVVSALDRKTVALAVMVLVACALAVGNAVSAGVRTQVTELGVLACLGWPRHRLFGLVLCESVPLGLAAGLGGTLLSLALAPLLGVHPETSAVLLALPCAVLLTLLASLLPAWRATRAEPAAAVRPAVLGGAVRRVRPRGIAGLAFGNLLRVPGRTLLGALSLAIGVAACTGLAVIETDFHGQVTGTVLGDAVTVQVAGVDLLAAAIIALLGAVSVADVLYLDIRERSAEFALLGATGWNAALLTRLAGYEAVGMGVLGSVLGAGLGFGAAGFAGTVPLGVYLTVALVALGGVVLTVLAALIPAWSLRRLPTARLLAEE